MGTFSNGSEGDNYEDQVCVHCTHYLEADEGTCPVWMLHLLYNYDALDEDKPELKTCLDSLIPPGNTYNLLCTMFVPSDKQGEFVKDEWDKYWTEKSKVAEREE